MSTTIARFITRVTVEGEEQLDDLDKRTKQVEKSMGGLKSAIAGLALGALIKDGMTVANVMSDLSKATNMSLQSIVGFGNAVAVNGGNIDKANDAISDLVKNIGEAAGGSSELQKAFGKAGVSLNDLATLSEQDILIKTIDGISRLGDASTQSSIKAKIFGEALKTVDLNSVNSQLAESISKAKEQAAATQAAADANRRLDESYQNLRQGAINALEPILKLLGENNVSVDAATKLFQTLGIIVGIVYGAKTIAAVKSFVDIIKVLNIALKSQVAIQAGLQALSGPKGWAVLAGSAVAAGAAIYGLNKLLEDNQELADTIPTPNAATGAPSTTPGRPVRTVVDANAKVILDSQRRIAQSIAEVNKLNALRGADDIEKIQIESQAEIANARKEINATENLSKEQKSKEFAAKEKEIMAKSSLEIFRIREGFERDLLQQRQGYMDQIQSLLGVEKSELQKINDQIALQPKNYREIGDQLRKNAAEQDKNLRFIKEFNKEQERQKTLSRDLFNLGLDRKFTENDLVSTHKKDLELLSARSSAERLEINERFEREQRLAQFAKSKLTDEIKTAFVLDQQGDATGEQIQMFMDYLNLLDTQRKLEESLSSIRLFNAKQLSELQGTFIYGWDKAFEAYAESAADAGKQAANSFENFTSGMEDALVNFVMTGKLSFKDLARSIIADLARIAARQAIVAAVSGPLGMLFGGGRSAGGSVAGGTSYIVGERGPELFVPQSAGKIISNSALKGSGQNSSSMGG